MSTPIKVFPKEGYLNSQFQILSDIETNLSIFKEGELVKELKVEPNNPVLITKLNGAGTYKIHFDNNKHQSDLKFKVKDAYRLGSSIFKSAFLFDNSSYSFILMKDRMYIYDELNRHLLLENDISPTKIVQISRNDFLFVTEIKNEDDGITNLGIYNTESFSMKGQLLNDFQMICFVEEEKLIWGQEISTNDIICYELLKSTDESFSEVKRYKELHNKLSCNDDSHLLLETDTELISVDMRNLSESIFDKNENIAIDKKGYVYHIDQKEIKCDSCFFEYNVKIENPPEQLAFNERHFFFLGSNFKNNGIGTTFQSEIDMIIENSEINFPENRTNYSHYIEDEKRVVKELDTCELFPSQNGILKVCKKRSDKLISLNFHKDERGDWIFKNPNISSNTKYDLVAISSQKEEKLLADQNSIMILDYHFHSLIFKADKHNIITDGSLLKRFHHTLDLKLFLHYNPLTSFIIVELDDTYNVYKLSSLEKAFLKNVDIKNSPYLEIHETIWYSVGNSSILRGYSLAEGEKLPSQYSSNGVSYTSDTITLQSGRIVNPKTGKLKGALTSKLLSKSSTFEKVLTYREEEGYSLNHYDSSLKRYEYQVLKLEVYGYDESYLSPDGQHLVLRDKANAYQLFDIEKYRRVKFFSGNFLAFSKEGNLIIEKDETRKAKIIDPFSFEDVTPVNYHFYRFLSPDGELYAQVVKNVRYFDKVQQEEISFPEFSKLSRKIQFPATILADPNSKQSKKIEKQVENNRREYFEKYKTRLNELNVYSPNDIAVFKIIDIIKYTEIGIVGTDETVEIQFPRELSYYNYAAFSYDNKFFAYVGKPPSKGLIHIFRINYDREEKTLSVIEDYLSTYPDFAAWVCGFSKTGYFATYDSTPDTYLIKCDDTLFSNKSTNQELRENIGLGRHNFYLQYKNWNKIPGKSFLCFSPSGNLIALSEQGYSPYSLGGYGHQESNVVHLANTESGKIKATFKEHGSRILDSKTKNVVFAGFSEDEKRLMTMSADGVVIVRNLQL